ncbi:MAG: NAD(P)/FAD-dependent oxidoreductase, partial [Candidatus Omnitrophica bacterium]|nr:NAD(P)/FAD-dependent oxidoreductase [Candidatus Omnitrophota bacterium]
SDLLGPLRLPSHPLLALNFGYSGLRPAAALLSTLFQKPPARALFAGLAAHAAMSLHKTCTASFGMILGILGHLTGWPIARGGSQQLAHALVSHFRSLGGRLLLNTPVTTLAELPAYAAVLCDVTPRQLLSLAADQLPAAYSRQLEHYRYGPGAFKIDWALNGPIPWKASGCARAATVHLGGAWQEIVAAEEQVWAGKIPEQPFVLLTQPTLFDGTRAPIGAHTAWAYCHVPHNASVDMTERIEAQVERFAAGFRQRILARHTFSPQALQRYNPNYIGGDINGGLQDFKQLYTRPLPRYVPYATPVPGLYLCSSSTPPGGGVHGLCGYHAAQAVLKKQSRFGSPTRIRP